MKKKLLFAGFSLLVSFNCFCQVNSEYGKALKKTFEVSGTEASYKTVIKQMFTMYKDQQDGVPDEIWEEFEREFLKTSLDDLTEMLVPVYQKYMSLSDLNKLIEFYQSPVGAKYAKNTPLIMQESMQIGRKWGEKLGNDFVKKLEEKGY